MRPFVVVPVLAVLAFGAWLGLRGANGDLVPTAPRCTAPDSPEGGARASVPNEGAADRVAAEITTKQGPESAHGRWIDVLVVDAASQQPVANAEVRWSNDDSERRLQELPRQQRQELSADPDEVHQRLGWNARTDGKGLARVAIASGSTLVQAFADGRYAEARIVCQSDAIENGWRLELEPDLTLRAQVVDIEGRPAPGVPVRILATSRDGQPAMSHPPSALTHGPHGIAVFRHLQTWGRKGAHTLPECQQAEWRVATVLPGFVDRGVVFDRAAPPVEPVVLQLPATGQLMARLLWEGRPQLGRVEFRAYRRPDRDLGEPEKGPWLPIDEDGWACFPHVALGGELVVRARLGENEVEGAVQAPTNRGQEVRVELTADNLIALRGRLIASDGKPLAAARVVGEVLTGYGQIDLELDTDAQGRFACFLGQDHVAATRLDSLSLRHSPGEGPVQRASIENFELRRGWNDLGDLRLESGPLVVSGQLVFEPADARPHVEIATEYSSGGRWYYDREVYSTQRADGTFEVRGQPEEGRHRLCFPSLLHLPIPPVEFEVGAKNLSIMVPMGGGLTASFLLPDHVPTNLLFGVLKPDGEVPEEGRVLQMQGMNRHGRYAAQADDLDNGNADLRWRALPSGSYTLEVRADGIKDPLAVIPDVVVPQPPGGDPRLRRIDLRNRIRTLKVHLVLPKQEEEEPDRLPFVFPMPQADPQEWEGLLASRGELVMLAPPGPIELLIVLLYHQPVRVVAVGSEVTVALEHWPTVELTFAGVPDLPEGIDLCVEPRDRTRLEVAEGMLDYHTRYVEFLSLQDMLRPVLVTSTVRDGRATVIVGAGTCSLDVSLRTRDTYRSVPLASVSPRWIVGGRNLPPIAVQLSADEIRQALAKLQAPPAK